MMDCDTTGIEPDLGLVKFKKLVGGGNMSIVNQTIPRALTKLGYTDAQIDEARAYLEQSQRVASDTPVRQLVDLDEGFHLRIADMAGNAELRRMLVSLNERIRFIRWIDMENVGRASTQHEHLEILQALSDRDAQASERLMAEHIGLRREQIVEAIARGLTRIYLPQEQVQATP